MAWEQANWEVVVGAMDVELIEGFTITSPTYIYCAVCASTHSGKVKVTTSKLDLAIGFLNENSTKVL